MEQEAAERHDITDIRSSGQRENQTFNKRLLYLFYYCATFFSPSSEPQPPPGHGSSRNLKPKSPEETRRRFTSDKTSGSGEAAHHISGRYIPPNYRWFLSRSNSGNHQGAANVPERSYRQLYLNPDSVARDANLT